MVRCGFYKLEKERRKEIIYKSGKENCVKISPIFGFPAYLSKSFEGKVSIFPVVKFCLMWCHLLLG